MKVTCSTCNQESNIEVMKGWVCQNAECRAWNPNPEKELSEAEEKEEAKKWLN